MRKFLVLLALWCTAISANASLITIDIEDKVYGVGDLLTANIYITELNTGPQQLVSTFSFDLASLDSLLTFQQARFGNMLDVDIFTFIPSDQVIDNASLNSLYISEFSFADSFGLLVAQDGFSRYLLASVDFTVFGLGLAEFSLNNVKVADDFGFEHQVLSAESANVRLGNQVSVPEPSTIAIFTLAMMLLLGSNRIRKS